MKFEHVPDFTQRRDWGVPPEMPMAGDDSPEGCVYCSEPAEFTCPHCGEPFCHDHGKRWRSEFLDLDCYHTEQERWDEDERMARLEDAADRRREERAVLNMTDTFIAALEGK